MNDPRITTGDSSPAELAAIEAALGDLAIDPPENADAITEIVIEANPENDVIVMDEHQAIELEAALARDESYEEQTATSDMVTEVPTAAEAAATPSTVAPAAKKARAASTPRVARDLSSLPAEAFVLTTEIPADLEANKTAVIGSQPTQKKIAEKFENILMSVAAGKTPSTYTMDCYRILKAKGEVTQGELVTALQGITRKDGSKTYGEGTARSQAGQIMTLFAALKIATRSGQKLTLNPDSMLAVALDRLSAPPAATAAPAATSPEAAA